MFGCVVDVRDVAAAHVRAAEVGRSCICSLAAWQARMPWLEAHYPDTRSSVPMLRALTTTQ